MKFALTLAAIASQAAGFAPNLHIARQTTFVQSNVLEGKEIANDFTPINNMVLVKKVDVVDKTEGGIFLTGKDKIKKSEGEIVAVGEGRINTETGFVSPMPVGVGDGVCFGKFTGEEVTYNGAKHHLIRDDDILVKFPAGTERTLENAEVIWDSVLVKVEKKKVEESGGILIAKTVKKAFKSSVGEVLKVGPGRYAFNGVLMENDVSPGDMVKFRDFAAQDVEIDGKEYSVVKMIDLLAKF